MIIFRFVLILNVITVAISQCGNYSSVDVLKSHTYSLNKYYESKNVPIFLIPLQKLTAGLAVALKTNKYCINHFILYNFTHTILRLEQSIINSTYCNNKIDQSDHHLFKYFHRTVFSLSNCFYNVFLVNYNLKINDTKYQQCYSIVNELHQHVRLIDINLKYQVERDSNTLRCSYSVDICSLFHIVKSRLEQFFLNLCSSFFDMFRYDCSYYTLINL